MIRGTCEISVVVLLVNTVLMEKRQRNLQSVLAGQSSNKEGVVGEHVF